MRILFNSTPLNRFFVGLSDEKMRIINASNRKRNDWMLFRSTAFLAVCRMKKGE